jgi:hypothetical protein
LIQQLESLFYDSKQQGMMVAIRIMLYYQRVVGLYYRKARDTLGTDVPAPNFEKLIDDLRMQSYDSLPRIPDSWVEVLKVQVPELFLTPVPVPRAFVVRGD